MGGSVALGFLLSIVVFVIGHAVAAKVMGRSLFREPLLFRAPGRQQLPALLAGPALGYFAAVGAFWGAHLWLGEPVTSLVVDVMPGQPAAMAGMVDGDHIVSVNGRSLQKWDELPQSLASAESDHVQIVVKRAGGPRRFQVQMRDGKIGVRSRINRRSIPMSTAFARALTQPPQSLASMVRGLWAILAGDRHGTVAGPVAMVRSLPTSPTAPAGGKLLWMIGLALSTTWPIVLGLDLVVFGAFAHRHRRDG